MLVLLLVILVHINYKDIMLIKKTVFHIFPFIFLIESTKLNIYFKLLKKKKEISKKQ